MIKTSNMRILRAIVLVVVMILILPSQGRSAQSLPQKSSLAPKSHFKTKEDIRRKLLAEIVGFSPSKIEPEFALLLYEASTSFEPHGDITAKHIRESRRILRKYILFVRPLPDTVPEYIRKEFFKWKRNYLLGLRQLTEKSEIDETYKLFAPLFEQIKGLDGPRDFVSQEAIDSVRVFLSKLKGVPAKDKELWDKYPPLGKILLDAGLMPREFDLCISGPVYILRVAFGSFDEAVRWISQIRDVLPFEVCGRIKKYSLEGNYIVELNYLGNNKNEGLISTMFRDNPNFLHIKLTDKRIASLLVDAKIIAPNLPGEGWGRINSLKDSYWVEVLGNESDLIKKIHAVNGIDDIVKKEIVDLIFNKPYWLFHTHPCGNLPSPTDIINQLEEQPIHLIFGSQYVMSITISDHNKAKMMYESYWDFEKMIEAGGEHRTEYAHWCFIEQLMLSRSSKIKAYDAKSIKEILWMLGLNIEFFDRDNRPVIDVLAEDRLEFNIFRQLKIMREILDAETPMGYSAFVTKVKNSEGRYEPKVLVIKSDGKQIYMKFLGLNEYFEPKGIRGEMESGSTITIDAKDIQTIKPIIIMPELFERFA